MMEEHRLPKFDYYLDESDPDIVVLRRQDGSYVAHFSASGATRETIVEVAKEDYKQPILTLSSVYFEWVRLPPEPKRFRGALPRRWVAERIIGWSSQSRRMSKDYERLCETSQIMIYVVMSRLMLRRLARV
jgi:hypothetical protein